MLNNETLNKLRYMKLTGMIEALTHQEDDPGYQEMNFNERLGLVVDHEFTRRQHSKLARIINNAKFQDSSACIENINYEDDRHLDRNFILELAEYSGVKSIA